MVATRRGFLHTQSQIGNKRTTELINIMRGHRDKQKKTPSTGFYSDNEKISVINDIMQSVIVGKEKFSDKQLEKVGAALRTQVRIAVTKEQDRLKVKNLSRRQYENIAFAIALTFKEDKTFGGFWNAIGRRVKGTAEAGAEAVGVGEGFRSIFGETKTYPGGAPHDPTEAFIPEEALRQGRQRRKNFVERNPQNIGRPGIGKPVGAVSTLNMETRASLATILKMRGFKPLTSYPDDLVEALADAYKSGNYARINRVLERFK